MDIYDSLQYLRNYTVNLEHLSTKGTVTHGIAKISTPNSVYRIPIHFNGSVEAYKTKCEQGLEHLVRQPTLFPIPRQPTLLGVYTAPDPIEAECDRPVQYDQLRLFEPNPYQLKLDF